MKPSRPQTLLVLRHHWDTRRPQSIQGIENSWGIPSVFPLRVVSLSKRQNIALPSNRRNAEKRLNSLTKRIESNEALRKIYDQVLNYITWGQVDAAPAEDSKTSVLSSASSGEKRKAWEDQVENSFWCVFSRKQRALSTKSSRWDRIFCRRTSQFT